MKVPSINQSWFPTCSSGSPAQPILSQDISPALLRHSQQPWQTKATTATWILHLTPCAQHGNRQ
eukprot:9186967-Heterocapsa_arctica.AAC.1